MLLNKFISGAFAFFIFLLFCHIFSGNSEFTMSSLNPITALEGLVFSFAFGTGLPIWLAYVVSILIFLGVPLSVYLLASRISWGANSRKQKK